MRVHMFLMIGLVVGVPAATAQEGSRVGEKLLLEMERKLLDAKALRITFEIEMPKGLLVKSVPVHVKGVLETTAGNRCRTEFELRCSDTDDKQKVYVLRAVEVSDGTKNMLTLLELKESGKPAPLFAPGADGSPAEAVPKEYNAWLAKTVARYGMFTCYVLSRSSASTEGLRKKLPERPGIRFKAVVKEKLAEKDVLKVEFEAKFDEANKSNIVVWIDATTKLPLLRSVHMNPFEKGGQIIETYSAIEINPKLDSKRFVLPKDK